FNVTMRPVVQRIEEYLKTSANIETHYRLHVTCPCDQAAVARSMFMRHVNSEPKMTVQGLSTRDTELPGMSAITVDVFAVERNDQAMNDLVSRVGIEPNVSGISWEKSH